MSHGEGPGLPEAAVAIVMRTKDRPLLLLRGVRDVLAQSFPDWVLLVVNDGGDPQAVDGVLAEVLADRPARVADRVAALHNPSSSGRWAAANQGIAATRSRYLVLHDDDDGWDPDFLTTTVQHLESTGAAGVMVRTEIVYERVVGDTVEETDRRLFWADITAITLVEMMRINRAVPISFLYRREAHERIGMYDDALPTVGDWEFHLRFLREYAVEFIDGRPLAFWHQRPGATGSLGNSVLAEDEVHRTSDLLVRESYLKRDVHDRGMGTLLYLTLLDDRASRAATQRAEETARDLRDVLASLRDVDRRLAALEAALPDAGIAGVLRRRYRRLRAR